MMVIYITRVRLTSAHTTLQHVSSTQIRQFHTNLSFQHKSVISTQIRQFHINPSLRHKSVISTQIRQFHTNPSIRHLTLTKKLYIREFNSFFFSQRMLFAGTTSSLVPKMFSNLFWVFWVFIFFCVEVTCRRDRFVWNWRTCFEVTWGSDVLKWCVEVMGTLQTHSLIKIMYNTKYCLGS